MSKQSARPYVDPCEAFDEIDLGGYIDSAEDNLALWARLTGHFRDLDDDLGGDDEYQPDCYLAD